MKKVKFFAMLLAAGMFAACSDDLGDAGDMGGNAPDATEGYVRVAIHTPTTTGSMTRAVDGSADLEDGTANEYKITDGVIAFFKAAKGETNPDANATFVSAYSLNGLTVQGGDGQQVTEKVVTVSKAPKVDKEEQLYALVILNTPPVVVVVGADDHSLTLGGTALTATSKLSAFTTALKDQNLTTYTGDNNDFTMCNAPLSDIAGSNLKDKVTEVVAKTLVPVEVYPTQNDALNNEAARIYVERVVAKVTLTGFTDGVKDSDKYTSYKKNVKGTSGSVYNGDVVELKGWILNVTNKSTALVRNVSGFKSDGWLAAATGDATNQINRFAGTSVIPMNSPNSGSTTNYYRIYWAKDGNYADPYDIANEFNTYSDTNQPRDDDWNKNTADNTTTDKDYALYCLENTMDQAHQNKNESTSVLLKTTYLTKFGNQATVSDQDFFICGANPIKYPKDNDITAAGGSGTVEDIITYVVKKANEVLTTKLSNANLEFVKDGEGKLTAKGGIYDNTTGKEFSKLFNLTEYTGTADDVWKAIKSQVGEIRYYKGGESYYYAAIIRHFSDTETPWSDGEAYEIQHLGRYGVVRNNWYEINVKSISGPGEPGIVKPEDEPDDAAEGYIRAEINVLSWAKRSQGVDL